MIDFSVRGRKLAFTEMKKDLSLIVPQSKRAKAPARVFIPLIQHNGAGATPIVKPGDKVLVGTKIAEADGPDSVAAHASISGEVKNLAFHPHPYKGRSLAIEIESDGEDTKADFKTPDLKKKVSREDIARFCQENGLVDQDALATPAHLKILNFVKYPESVLIVNGMGCEPYVSSHYPVMMERTTQLIRGARLLGNALGVKQIVLVGSKEEEETLERVNSKQFARSNQVFKTVALPSRYPQTDERILTRDILGQELSPGELPEDRGITIWHVSTIAALNDAFYNGKPYYEKAVTVSGECVVEPMNVIARFGTTVKDLFRCCKGLMREPGRVVVGGPLSGVAVQDLQTPIVKNSSAVLALPKENIDQRSREACIRCGSCVESCPVNIDPCMISLSVEAERFDLLGEFGPELCIECGNCSYVCPSHRPMLEWMQEAKGYMPCL